MQSSPPTGHGERVPLPNPTGRVERPTSKPYGTFQTAALSSRIMPASCPQPRMIKIVTIGRRRRNPGFPGIPGDPAGVVKNV